MLKGFQIVKQQLASFPITGAGNNFAAKLRDLYTQIDGRFAHLVGFVIEVTATPTYTTTPTQAGIQKVLSLIEFTDGRQVRFRGNGNDLRQFERLEHGKTISADPKVAAAMTGNPRYYSRFLPMGPALFEGNPSDFAIPCCLLMNGELRIASPTALTDLSADCTALTGNIIVTALLVPLDEIRIPPFYERQTQTLSSDDRITGKGLYAYVAASKSIAYGAFAAGEVGTVLAETGTFSVVNTINASVLGRTFNTEMMNGAIGGIQAEPLNATHDTNQRDPDYSGSTALLAGIADLQPYLWCLPGTRISKIAARVESSLHLKSSGSVTSGLRVHVARFLPQGPDVILAMQEEAQRQLNVRGTLKIKTLSKEEYSGPYAAYMPWAVKVAR